MDTTTSPRVVVGVDGSPGSRVALVHALTAAARRDAVLEVVGAYPLTYVYTGGFPLHVPDEDALRKDTESRVRDLVDGVRHELTGRVAGVDRVAVELTVAVGRPVPVLLDVAEDADLLVVGSRGHGGFSSMLLGSTTMQCALHATCPVTVVHSPEAHKHRQRLHRERRNEVTHVH